MKLTARVSRVDDAVMHEREVTCEVIGMDSFLASETCQLGSGNGLTSLYPLWPTIITDD